MHRLVHQRHLLRDLEDGQAVPAKTSHPRPELGQRFAGAEPDLRGHDLSRDGVRLGADGDVLHALHGLQHALHLGRVDFFPTDVDDLGLPSANAEVLPVHLDGVAGRKPPVGRERAGSVEIAQHHRSGPDLQHAVDHTGLEPFAPHLDPERIGRTGLRAQDADFREAVGLQQADAREDLVEPGQRALRHHLGAVRHQLQAGEVVVHVGLARQQEVDERR